MGFWTGLDRSVRADGLFCLPSLDHRHGFTQPPDSWIDQGMILWLRSGITLIGLPARCYTLYCAARLESDLDASILRPQATYRSYRWYRDSHGRHRLSNLRLGSSRCCRRLGFGSLSRMVELCHLSQCKLLLLFWLSVHMLTKIRLVSVISITGIFLTRRSPSHPQARASTPNMWTSSRSRFRGYTLKILAMNLDNIFSGQPDRTVEIKSWGDQAY